MADSVVYGPESRNSAWDAWRTRISSAVSNKPAAINEQENDGSEMGGPEIGRPEINGPRVKGWVYGSSFLASSNGVGATAALRASRNPAQDAKLANIRGVWRHPAGSCIRWGEPGVHYVPGIGRLRVVYNPCVVYNHGRISLCHLGSWFAGLRCCWGSWA
jgi:hypothetical protein